MANDSIKLIKPVDGLIREIRGQRVILDSDLARVYGVTTKRLNEAVKRNLKRFPPDFMFRLAPEDVENLRSHFATSSKANRSAHGGRRYLPFAFTEHGAIQAANVLNSERAIEMGVFAVRAFVKMRETLVSNRQLAEKVAELERTLFDRLDIHDHLITGIIKQLIRLSNPQGKPTKQIGFHVSEKRSTYKTRKTS